MKNQLCFYLFFSLTLFSIYSCKKDNDSNPQPNNLPSFSAKINGAPFVSSSTFCLIHSDHDLQFRAFSLLGNNQGKMMTLTFMDGELSESINANTSANWFGLQLGFEDSLSTNTYNQLVSNLQFTFADSTTNTISGIFSGVVVGTSPPDTLFITDGVFQNINYIYEFSY